MTITFAVVATLALVPQAAATRDLVDLRRIGHIESKGRVQDQHNSVVDTLIKAVPSAAPFLQSKLEDRTRIPGFEALDFWPGVEVGHVALIVLRHLFTRPDGRTSTVPGFSWAEILGAGQDTPAREVYRAFVVKHGRSGIDDGSSNCWRPTVRI